MNYSIYPNTGLCGWFRVNPSDTLSWEDMIDWCNAQESTGHYSISPAGGWWFRKEKDAMLFALRWT